MSGENNNLGNISFDLPKHQSNVIKVIGVGGGGSNAINYMYQQGIKGVDFVVCNTDAQALQNSPVPNKVQLGVSLTEGLGAGANPEVGEQAAVESLEELQSMLDTNTKMVFITAGMGGGTGTGAAPIIAKIARDMNILTVGIVTSPFQFEGKNRCAQAQKGVERLRSNVDSLIVINNNKLREVYGNLGFKAGFSKADEVLATAARGIAEVITHHYTQNIDLRDAKTVLSNSGTAIMGSSTSTGSNRAQEAIMKALDSPLLNDNKISGAQNVLLLIVSGTEEITLDEIGEINDHIQEEAGHNANIIMGVGEDEELGDAISVTIIATGFNSDQQHEITNTEVKRIIHTLEDEQKATHDLSPEGSATGMIKTDRPVQQPPRPEAAKPVVHQLEDPEEAPVQPELPMQQEQTIQQQPKQEVPTIDLVPTSELIRNMEVTFEEVKAKEEDFVIIDTTNEIRGIDVVDAQELQREEEEKQISLSFDLPLQETKPQEEEVNNTITFDLGDEVNDMEVKDPVEVVSETPKPADEPTIYSLGDYLDVEETLNSARAEQPGPASKPTPKPAEVMEEEFQVEKKVVPAEEVPQVRPSEEADPFNSSIEDSLRKRAEERRRKLKDFNYKFQNNTARIDEIEKQPAYKRMGIDLQDHRSQDTSSSRMSIGSDSNDEVQLRSNNSFLHDNVD
ncbi:cell division protein FtsZ [Robertkochia sediminum]|uniref:cell division protein FtsZ n=1 Tax=Robertkochia sediminum TaxID=2785326 RepID=UPI00193396EF|nr:cell division protein FtsZ [Robertkochia sediminum]MBL7472479.1 cell division protein FtsZ [Robertkochia sediminum]